MFFTPGQLRGSVGLSKEAFRHWKRVVPGFANGRRHAPSFSPGDVLASAVLRRLTDAAGVRIGHLSDIAPAIFKVCNVSSWELLQHKFLVIDLQAGTCVAASDSSRPVGDLLVVCALAPLVKALRFNLLDSGVPSAGTPFDIKSTERSVRKQGQR
jgi:hypothetical protein